MDRQLTETGARGPSDRETPRLLAGPAGLCEISKMCLFSSTLRSSRRMPLSGFLSTVARHVAGSVAIRLSEDAGDQYAPQV